MHVSRVRAHAPGRLSALRDNLAAADLDLDDAALARLSEVSAPEMSDYPYGPMGIDQRDRKLTGGR